MVDRDGGLADDQRIRFRVGINLGDIIVEAGDIFGDGINTAARLEALAQPGGICLSAAVREQVGDRLGLASAGLGEQTVKNINRPLRAWELGPDAIAATPLVPIAVLAPPTARSRSRRAGATRRRLSIVVLPLVNLSSDPEHEGFVGTITDDLTSDLSRTGCLVIPHATALAYKGQVVDAKDIGRKLNVRYILSGNVRLLASHFYVNVQFSDTDTGGLVWADRFDTGGSDVAIAHDQIVSRLTRACG